MVHLEGCNQPEAPASGVTFYKILGLLVKRTLVTKDYQLRAAIEEAREMSEDDFQLHHATVRDRNLLSDRQREGLMAQGAAEAESSAAGAREAPLVNPVVPFNVGAVRNSFAAAMEEVRAETAEAEAESEEAPAEEEAGAKRQKTT